MGKHLIKNLQARSEQLLNYNKKTAAFAKSLYIHHIE